MKILRASASIAALLASASVAQANPVLTIDQIWTNTPSDAATSEIVAFDPISNRVFVAAGDEVDVIFFNDQIPGDNTAGTTDQVLNFDPAQFGAVNSVAVSNGKLAVAVQASETADVGTVFIYDTADLAAGPDSVTVGVLPDMLTFTPDGSKIIVANEGEPEGYTPGDIDPDGSISVIDVATLDVKEAGFSAFDSQREALRDAGVRIFNPDEPGRTVSQDLEPEYIAVSSDGETAYVALQENNALAIVDLSGADPQVTDIVPLGLKDYGLPGNGIDPSDRDGGVNIAPQPGVVGMFQPDGIDTITIGGTEYIVSANEGDARDYDGLQEESRADDVPIAPGALADRAADDAQLGRLEVTLLPGITADGIDANGDFSTLFSFGGRSFSLWDSEGELKFDSGDFIDRKLEELGLYPDGRSDAKGGEPEAVEVGVIDDRTYLFLGLERASTIMIFDLTDFTLGSILDDFYVGNIFDQDLLRPEGLSFFIEDDIAYLLAAFEGDGDGGEGTSLFRITQVSEPATLGLLGLGLVGVAALRQRKRS